MFRNWGFLLGEIWVLLAVAALLGLLIGWLIWGRRAKVKVISAEAAEAARLRQSLSECEAKTRVQAGRMAGLEKDLADTKARITAGGGGVRADAEAAKAKAATPMAIKRVMISPAAAAVPLMAVDAPVAQVKPEGLSAARDGKADDLKLIKGIGPKLEVLCNRLGFWHFDQIADWTAAEIAWVDDNLEGFKGRVTRDEWVVQARELAAGGAPRAGGEH